MSNPRIVAFTDSVRGPVVVEDIEAVELNLPEGEPVRGQVLAHVRAGTKILLSPVREGGATCLMLISSTDWETLSKGEDPAW